MNSQPFGVSSHFTVPFAWEGLNSDSDDQCVQFVMDVVLVPGCYRCTPCAGWPLGCLHVQATSMYVYALHGGMNLNVWLHGGTMAIHLLACTADADCEESCVRWSFIYMKASRVRKQCGRHDLLCHHMQLPKACN
jgi:hypothetical protein